MAAGEDDRLGAERVDGADELLRPDLLAGVREHACLGHVRRDDGGAREEQRSQGALSVLVEKPGAALGDHHGVEHDRSLRHEVQRLVDRLDRRRRAEHADLHGIYADVLGNRPNLFDDDFARNRMDRGDRDGVLGGDRGDRGHPVDPTAGERLEIRLNARPAAGIRAGDGENAR